MRKFFILALAVLAAASCGSAGNAVSRAERYAGFYKEKPVVLMVMPPINATTNVDAKDLLYTSISRPLIEAGYYVVSPLLTMDILMAESAYDAELFADKPLGKFREVFGADAVVFTEILTWAKQGFGVDTKIRYYIKSTTSNEIIFDRTCDLYLDTSINSAGNSTLGAIINLAASAINTATTEHIEAARQANYYIFRDIPYGKYSPDYLQDMEEPSESPTIRAVVK